MMRTKTTTKGVLYQVVKASEVVWEKFVPFGHDKQHRAGGIAFREAAHEQEDFAIANEAEDRTD